MTRKPPADLDAIFTRFFGAGQGKPVQTAFLSPVPERIEVVYQVIRTMRQQALRVDFVLYLAFSESEAYEYAASRYPNKRKWWRVKKVDVRREEPL